MLKDELRNVLRDRIALDDNDSDAVEKCCEKEVEILSRDINETILFMDTDCTADEFSWISEIFDEIVKKTQSREFIDCLCRVAKKYPDECEKYNISYFIEASKEFLD